MSVKTIFKALIGTLVVMVVTSLIIEMFNLSITSLQINQTTKMAGKQACVLFSQETYKQFVNGEEVGGSVNERDVIDTKGNVYVTGEFYSSEVPEEIYNSIYTSDDFKKWTNDSEIQKGDWYNLKLINRAINNPESLNVAFGKPGYTEAMTAKLYKEVMMTPSNLGIPYLDPTVVNKMFRWNLAQLLSNCNKDSIQIGEDGKSYVNFRGFKVYADMAKIYKFEYKTFDLEDSKDRIEFNKITNIDPDNLGFMYDNNLEETIDSKEDERKRVCLVGIHYGVPITYEGITPLKRIFNYVWENEVDGYNDSAAGRTSRQEWNDSPVNLESGGLYGNKVADDVLPIPGKLIYYIIK